MNQQTNQFEKYPNINNFNIMGNKVEKQKFTLTHIEANFPNNKIQNDTKLRNNNQQKNQYSINYNDCFNLEGYNSQNLNSIQNRNQNIFSLQNNIPKNQNVGDMQNINYQNQNILPIKNDMSHNHNSISDQNINIIQNINPQNQNNYPIKNNIPQAHNILINPNAIPSLNAIPQNNFSNQIIDSNPNKNQASIKIQPQNLSQNKINNFEVNNNQISSNYFENNYLKNQNENNNTTANSNLQFYNINEISKPIENENKHQNKQIEGNDKVIKSNNLFTNTILTDEEILKCKENGFILIGKTGVGKTSLLNIIFGKQIGKVGHTSKSETKFSNFYCIKENIQDEIVYFCIVDTPGLYDCEGFDVDKEQKTQIIKLISKENIKIKCLLFLSNFQNERFDASEQMSLLSYNVLFPLKNFWERILLVFTHYYGDPNGDSKEEIRQKSDELISDIFKAIMKKTKKISKSLEYKDLQKLYINIYPKEKNEIQKKNNLEIRNSLLIQIRKFIKFPPMFCKVKILYLEKFELEKNDKYLYDCNCYYFLDINDNPVHTEYKILNKYPKNSANQNNQKIHLNEENFTVDKNGNIIKNITEKKKGIKEFIKNYKGEGLTCVSLISTITGLIFPPTIFVAIPSLIGGLIMLKNKYENNEHNTNENNNLFDYGFEWI